jgi:lipid-binding SYLF domain-containing protein
MHAQLFSKHLVSRVAVGLLTCVFSLASVADTRQEARLDTSTRVLTELMMMPEQNIPTWLLERAHAVAVIPSVIKVGLGIGGRRGKGVLVVRKENGEWSNPVFVNLTGGSFGFQVGVQSTDVVLVFTSRKSIEGIVGGKVTLGADASVAAGPVGRQSSAATDVGLTAQVYSYSRAMGLFAGVALDGSAMTIDNKSNESFYSRPGVLASEIVRADAPAAPEPAGNFLAALNKSVHGQVANAAPRTGGHVATAPTSAPSSTAQESQQHSENKTYPLEDQHPGEEPPE